MHPTGVEILAVDSGSKADKIGLSARDRILEINGYEITDELALRFYLADERITLLVRRSGEKEELLTFDASEMEDFGIRIEEFRTRTCNNACIFCFVDQLPSEVRPSLKIKDDDYRLSFLHGNYITLTNLTNRDLTRIIEQRLSPLYVSVHATEPDLRTRILGRKKDDSLLAKIDRLVKHRITLHAQIVLMPGVNDDKHLEKTVSDLHGFYPGVQSVAVVPLGLSDHGLPEKILRPVTPVFCRKVIRQVTTWQSSFRRRTGETFVHLADEFYIQGGVVLPEAFLYDDFAQIEDGVGMVRTFLDAFELEWKRRRKSLGLKGTLVTGRLFYPTLHACMERFNQKFGSRLQVCKAENTFLGKRITVAGLLSGKDILKALEGTNTGDFVIIPQEVLSKPEGILLDDLSIEDLSDSLGKPVYHGGSTVREFFLLMKKLSATGR